MSTQAEAKKGASRTRARMALIVSAGMAGLVVLYLLGFAICFRWLDNVDDFSKGDMICFSFIRDGDGYAFRTLTAYHRSWFRDADWQRCDDALELIYRPLLNRLWAYDGSTATANESHHALAILGRFKQSGAYGMVGVAGDQCFLITIDGLFAGWKYQHRSAMGR
jgi:hypothetical protein